MRFHQFLNAGRAMPLCWMANAVSKPKSTNSARPRGAPGALSKVVGVRNPPMKPIPYKKTAKKTR